MQILISTGGLVRSAALLLTVLTVAACASGRPPPVDLLVTNARVYDGLGGPPFRGAVAVSEGRIVAVGSGAMPAARQVVDADGLALAPGFINMLSWGVESLIEDGRSLSDLRQGVTLEVFGEGMSWGPWNDAMKADLVARQGDIRYDIHWNTLADYLDYLVQRGIATNVASFVGATTVRVHELGYADRAPSPQELSAMQALVRSAMRDGALGLGSSLIYAPAFYADTDELVALARVAGECGGMYISHLRSEGDRLLEAVDELIEIARRANLPAEIYHLKAAGQENWGKLDEVIAKVEAARREGLRITADMYTYTAGATGFDAAMPPWVQEGGLERWIERLSDPAIRARVLAEMRTPSDAWENLYLKAGSPDRVLLMGFKSEALKPLTGKTLAAVAEARGISPEDAIIDLVIADGSRVGVAYFLMSEDNIRKKIRLPWMSFGSDAGSMAPEGVFLLSNPHPRGYGNFARLLGRYVREEQIITLPEAIRRLTSMPAAHLGIGDRGALKPGYFADLVVFDPDTIADHATFENPHQLATGVTHVWVNGKQVLKNGQPTGATPGQVVRGPGCR